MTRTEALCGPREAPGSGGGGGSHGPGTAAAQGPAWPPMSRGTMPQPGAWPGASCAETPAREAGAAAREGGKLTTGAQPRAAMRCPAEQ